MAKEQFLNPGTKELCKLIDQAGHKAGFGRGQAFEDFLTLTTCCLATGLMEDEYLATVRKGYDKGESGKRGVDYFTKALATLVNLMEETRQDVLGDLFCGGITYGEAGQFFTPDAICTLLGELVGPETNEAPLHTESTDTAAKELTVYDPCCGSGRMLLAYAEKHPEAFLVGQDVDLRCVRMTTINIALRGRFGYILWGNSLGMEVKRGFRAGENLSGRFVREMRPDEIARYAAPPQPSGEKANPFSSTKDATSSSESSVPPPSSSPIEPTPPRPSGTQRKLFE